MINRTTEPGHLFHHRTAEEAVLCGCRQKNGFHCFGERSVRVGDLKLVFEITHGTKPAQDEIRAMGHCTINSQSIETDHFNPLEMRRCCLDLSNSLFHAECRLFVGVGQHSDDDLAEQTGRSFDQVHVPVGERVKTARVKRPHPTRQYCSDPMQGLDP